MSRTSVTPSCPCWSAPPPSAPAARGSSALARSGRRSSGTTDAIPSCDLVLRTLLARRVPAGEMSESEADLLLDGRVGGQVAARDGVCRFGLGVTEAHKSGDDFFGLDAGDGDGGGGGEFIAEVEDDAGGELLAYAGSAGEGGGVAGGDGVRELVCFED